VEDRGTRQDAVAPHGRFEARKPLSANTGCGSMTVSRSLRGRQQHRSILDE